MKFKFNAQFFKICIAPIFLMALSSFAQNYSAKDKVLLKKYGDCIAALHWLQINAVSSGNYQLEKSYEAMLESLHLKFHYRLAVMSGFSEPNDSVANARKDIEQKVAMSALDSFSVISTDALRTKYANDISKSNNCQSLASSKLSSN
jgi:hypothetical protein